MRRLKGVLGLATMLLVLTVPTLVSAQTFDWQVYGGTWTINNTTNVYTDSSTGPGDKLVATNINLSNFVLDGDVTLSNTTGNSGFNFRMSNPSVGTDALDGYYAGISTSGIYLGKENGSWTQLASAPLSLSTGVAYNLEVVANGPSIQVLLNGVQEISYSDSTYTTGEIGLRAMEEPTTFSNISVSPQVGPPQSVNALATIYPGALSITPPTVATAFPAFILSGVTQTGYATLSNWSIIDSSGTGDGWNVQVQASQFTEVAPSSGFATGTSAFTLPQGSLSLTGSRVITAASGSTPVSSTGGPNLAVKNPTIDLSSPVVFIEAQSGDGMGTYTVQEPLSGLSLVLNPSTTKVDAINYPSQPTPYSTVITFTVVTGP